MSYESSGQYFDDLSHSQQDWALENLIADAACDGYFGNPIASNDSEYLRAYEVGEARRFAEVRQEAEAIAQRLELSRQRMDALGVTIAGVKADLSLLGDRVEAGLAGSTATLSRLDSLGIELASLRLEIEAGEF